MFEVSTLSVFRFILLPFYFLLCFVSKLPVEKLRSCFVGANPPPLRRRSWISSGNTSSSRSTFCARSFSTRSVVCWNGTFRSWPRKRSSIIAVSRFYQVKLQALFIYVQNCLHQNAGAVRHILRCCKFFWRVADSTGAWNEDHSDWND